MAVSFSAKLDQLDLLQSNAFNKMNGVSSGTNITRINSIFSNGVQNAGQFRAQLQNTSIFDIAKSQSTQADSAQTSTTQKAGADASSSILSSLNNLFNVAQNSFNNVITMVQDAITASTADASALQSPQTTGPSINPETNLTTDNEGTEPKADTPKDNGIGMLGGEDTITDTGNDIEAPQDDIEAPEDEPVDTPKEPETSDAPETSSDIDKSEIKQQEQQRLEEERRKAEEEYKFVEVAA